MTPLAQEQPVLAAEPVEERDRAERGQFLRRVIAGPAGLALLLAGGGMLVRVATLGAQYEDAAHHVWLYTAVACLFAGVALVLITLPKIVPADRGDREPTPVLNG